MAATAAVERSGADVTDTPLDVHEQIQAIEALADLVHARTAVFNGDNARLAPDEALDSELGSPELLAALSLFRSVSERLAEERIRGIEELRDHLASFDRQLQKRRDLDFLTAHGVITTGKNGHFEYTSGRHGMHYAEKFRLLEQPAVTAELCTKIAGFARGLEKEPSVIVGPMTGGIIVAYETARQMGGGVRTFFAEPNGQPGQLHFGRGFSFSKDQPVLVVDDVLTTGGSLLKTIDAVKSADGRPVGVAVLINRSKIGDTFADLPFQACLTVDLPQFEPSPEACPRCAEGIPVESPKS